jgi:hypothetical protein
MYKNLKLKDMGIKRDIKSKFYKRISANSNAANL